MSVRVLSLFSGAGGLDIGFLKAGFDVIASVELEPKFCKTIDLNKNNYFSNKHQTLCADITKFDPKDLEIEEFDFIIGGPPCQSFSAAGRRAGGVSGINDERGSLFWHYCRILKYYQPKGFLFENVRGILQANKQRDWEVIKQSFEELGYTLSYQILDAADYGVPQHRERVIIVGIKNQKYLFPRPTHGEDSISEQPLVSISQALKDIDDPNEEILPYGGKYGHLLNDIPPGMNYLYYTEKMGHPNPIFAWRSKFSDFLYKAHPDFPCKTIVASQGKYGGPFHWRGRKFKINELKRLQSFPDDYEIYGTEIVAVKQIGNSVAPLFAEVIAKSVMKQVFDTTMFSELELVTEDFEFSFDKRKRRKARDTKLLVKPNQKLNQGEFESNILFDQKMSFSEEWIYTNLRRRLDEVALYESSFKDHIYGIYEVEGDFSKGTWDININKRNALVKQKIMLNLSFPTPVMNKLKAINCIIETDTFLDIGILWDSVDFSLKQCISYPNIQPLYGHFTEPYPKFTISIEAEVTFEEDKNILSFLKKICDYKYLSTIHPLSDLELLMNKETGKGLEIAKQLRTAGFDIRVHETNRAIPQGYFRCCYPFTTSLDAYSFVTWQEIGTHKTADKTSIPDYKKRKKVN